MLKEIIENLNEKDQFKTYKDKDIMRNVADWIFDVQIMDMLDANWPSENMKQSIKKAMKNSGMSDQEDLYSIWSTMDRDTTDKILDLAKLKKDQFNI